MLFARKTAKLSGKKQGISDTVQLSRDESGFAFIQFPQKLFLQSPARSEAVYPFSRLQLLVDCPPNHSAIAIVVFVLSILSDLSQPALECSTGG